MFPDLRRQTISTEHRWDVRYCCALHPCSTRLGIAGIVGPSLLPSFQSINEQASTTIRHYKIPRPNTPRGGQTWRTFIRNHGKAVWSCDFLIQHTAFFAIAYVFVLTEIGSHRIVHVNVTDNPTLPWVKQQIREATADGIPPRFLVHDNDGIFGQYGACPSQAIHAIPNPYPELREPPPPTVELVALPVLGGVLHDSRRAA